MNESPNIPIYLCPSCCQGGLLEVLITTTPPRPAVVCQECDRIWIAPQKVDLQTDTFLEEQLEKLGVVPNWQSLIILRKGVGLDQIDLEYRTILFGERNEASAHKSIFKPPIIK